MSAFLEIKDVNVSFGSTDVIRQLNLQAQQGEMLCLLGPSGSGKTTLLRAIAGFQSIQSGEILLNGFCLSKAGWKLRPEARGIGIVFQDFALFPHLNVEENLRFGLSGVSVGEASGRVERLLELVGILHLRRHYPHQISGGEKQRLAIARALAPDPRLLLLDEPLSQLDPDLRTHLATQMRQVLKSLGTTAVMVTHSQTEAFDFGDRIAVMRQGRIQQLDTAYQLYHEPSNDFVADFIGRGTFIGARVESPTCLRSELGALHGELSPEFQCGDQVSALVRPDDVIHDPESPLRLKVVSRSFRGPYFLYQLATPQGQKLLSLIPSHFPYHEGDLLPVRLKMQHLICFRSVDKPEKFG